MWSDLEDVSEEFGGARSVIVKLEEEGDSDRECLLVMGVTFSCLVCLGTELSEQFVTNCRENTLVFKLHQHYFVANHSLKEPLDRDKERCVEVPNMSQVECKSSYDETSMVTLVGALRALKAFRVLNIDIKTKISTKGSP